MTTARYYCRYSIADCKIINVRLAGCDNDREGRGTKSSPATSIHVRTVRARGVVLSYVNNEPFVRPLQNNVQRNGVVVVVVVTEPVPNRDF